MATVPPRTALLTLMRLENKQAAKVRAILTKSANQINREILKLPEGSITKLQAEAQKKAIVGYLQQDFSDIEKVVVEGQKAAARAASNVVSMYEETLYNAVMDKSAVKAIAVSEAQRAANGVEAAIRRMEGSSYKPLSKQVYDTRKLASGWVDDKVNQALISGWSAARLAKEVKGSINPDVAGGVSYAANRLARTEINNAFHASAAKRYEESVIVEGVDWNLSTSHPEGDICDSLAADSPYDKKAVPQKPHPFCYCFITPALPDEEEFTRRLLAGEYGDEPWIQDVKPEKVASAAKRGASTSKSGKYKKEASSVPKVSAIQDSEDPTELLNKVYSGRSYNGFRVEVTGAEYTDRGIGYQMMITKDGNFAGQSTRVLTDDGYVVHDILELSEEFRGKGFSTAFSEFSEEWYKASGIKGVKLEAGLADGGYTWAKAGYSWDVSVMRDVTKLTEHIQNESAKITLSAVRANPALEEAYTWLSDLREKSIDVTRAVVSNNADDLARAYAAMPTPAEIANKSFPGMETLGKDLMRGTDWFGVKPMA